MRESTKAGQPMEGASIRPEGLREIAGEIDRAADVYRAVGLFGAQDETREIEARSLSGLFDRLQRVTLDTADRIATLERELAEARAELELGTNAIRSARTHLRAAGVPIELVATDSPVARALAAAHATLANAARALSAPPRAQQASNKVEKADTPSEAVGAVGRREAVPQEIAKKPRGRLTQPDSTPGAVA